MSASRDTRLEELAARFIDRFEHVFGDDWEHTRACLSSPDCFVDRGHTFINPGQFDESNNWCSRSGLLEAYRCLAEELMKRGVHADDYQD
jgi:hypothetical protein